VNRPRRLFYCDHHEIPLPPGHRFPLAKYRLLRERLAAERLYAFKPAPLADAEAIARAHDPEYVAAFLAGSLPPAAMRRIGFPWSQGLVQRTLASAGGTLAAARDALETGFGGTLAGGTHHAFRGEGAGYCVFNDVAVAIHALRHEARARRFAVIDLDVHQGDGTAHSFAYDPDVFTLSVHAARNFPFHKQRSSIDVELADGTADAEYLDSLHGVLPNVAAFGPELVFYLSGVDALASDSLGRLALTHQGLAERDRRVMELCVTHGFPMAITLGGGYSHPIEATVEAHANTFRMAAEMFQYKVAGTCKRFSSSSASASTKPQV
jgi:acetoin utilization deacetylase AcuC-like enzyme